MSDLTEAQLKTRFESVVQSTGDAHALVLKAQLLVEEMLDSYLTRIFVGKKCYVNARLSFNQKYNLVKSHICLSELYDESDQDLHLVKLTFDYIGSLNRLRNKIAHNVELPELGHALRRELELPDTATDAEVVQEVRGHIFYLYFYLERFVEGLIESTAGYDQTNALEKLKGLNLERRIQRTKVD